MKKSFDDTFLAHAYSVFKNLPLDSVSDVMRRYAMSERVKITYPETPKWNDSRHFLDNLHAFSNEIKFEILEELSDFGLGMNAKRREFKKILYSDYGNFKKHGRTSMYSAEIEKTFHWLEEYPNSLTQYHKSVAMFAHYHDSRDTLDNIRLCIEIFMKEILQSNADWNILVKELEEKVIKDITPEFKNVFFVLLNKYITFQNKDVKHNSNVRKEEVEFVFEISLTFLRVIARIHSK